MLYVKLGASHKMKMNITYVNPYFYPQQSGIERLILNVARRQSQYGATDVSVVTSTLKFPHGVFNSLADQEQIDGVQIYRKRVLTRNFGRRFTYLSNGGTIVPGLISTIIKTRPDVIHVYNVGAPVWLLCSVIAARMTGSKLVYSPHYHPPYDDYTVKDQLKSIPMDCIHGVVYRFVDCIVQCTEHDVKAFRSYAPKSEHILSEVIPPGANVNICRSSRSRNKILFVGRVDDKRKGFDFVESAFRLVIVDFPEANLEIIGQCSGEMKSYLHTRYGESVNVRGVVDDNELTDAMASSLLLVMPSRYEGFGMPYVEAMSCGTPVVGSNIGPIPEVIPTDCSYIVEVGDVKAIAEIMARHLRKPELSDSMGVICQQYSLKYDWEIVAKAHNVLYTTLMNRN
jgi:glycosyltransferase involved in cell wall biosynthesis